jgi:hypothetical protein
MKYLKNKIIVLLNKLQIVFYQASIKNIKNSLKEIHKEFTLKFNHRIQVNMVVNLVNSNSIGIEK